MMWGGAQWVLATLLVVATVLPILVKVSGLADALATTRPGSWGVRFAVNTINRIGLVVVLWWGGFWS